MDLELRGKAGLVIAGSKGLGRAIAEAWAAEGVEVAVLARSREALDLVEAFSAEGGGRIRGYVADLTDPASVEAAMDRAVKDIGPIDLLLLNTGGPPASHAVGVDVALWESTYRELVLQLIQIAERCVPDMRARGFGRVLYIGSPGIVSPLPYVAMAQTMRAAMAVWLKALAAQVGEDGVTINTIIPGMIETERMWSLSKARADLDGLTMDDHVRQTVSDVPLRRLGRPEEFAAVAAFLASPKAAYVTGSLIRVDGGWIKAL